MSVRNALYQILCLIGNLFLWPVFTLLYAVPYFALVFAASLIVTIALTFVDSPVMDFARAYSYYGLIVYVLLGLLTIFAITTEDFMDRCAGGKTYLNYLCSELWSFRIICLAIPLGLLAWPYAWLQMQREMNTAGCGEHIADAFIRPLDYWYHHKYWIESCEQMRANEKDSTD
jgi:hypothetical protein